MKFVEHFCSIETNFLPRAKKYFRGESVLGFKYYYIKSYLHKGYIILMHDFSMHFIFADNKRELLNFRIFRTYNF